MPQRTTTTTTTSATTTCTTTSASSLGLISKLIRGAEWVSIVQRTNYTRELVVKPSTVEDSTVLVLC